MDDEDYLRKTSDDKEYLRKTSDDEDYLSDDVMDDVMMTSSTQNESSKVNYSTLVEGNPTEGKPQQ